MRITLKIFGTNHTFEVCCNEISSIDCLQQTIINMGLANNTDKITLLFKGKILDSKKTLVDYKVSKNDQISISIRNDTEFFHDTLSKETKGRFYEVGDLLLMFEESENIWRSVKVTSQKICDIGLTDTDHSFYYCINCLYSVIYWCKDCTRNMLCKNCENGKILENVNSTYLRPHPYKKYMNSNSNLKDGDTIISEINSNKYVEYTIKTINQKKQTLNVEITYMNMIFVSTLSLFSEFFIPGNLNDICNINNANTMLLFYGGIYNCDWCFDHPYKCCSSCQCKTCLRKTDMGYLISCFVCKNVVHNYCLDIMIPGIPADKWFCNQCQEKKNLLLNNDFSYVLHSSQFVYEQIFIARINSKLAQKNRSNRYAIETIKNGQLKSISNLENCIYDKNKINISEMKYLTDNKKKLSKADNGLKIKKKLKNEKSIPKLRLKRNCPYVNSFKCSIITNENSVNKYCLVENVKKKKRSTGYGNAGRRFICTSVPPTHFGPIPGIDVGMSWEFRIQASEVGVHRPVVSGISGRNDIGAFSVVLSGGYEDDIDNGDEFFYTGSGGRDLTGNKRTAVQSRDQELTNMNKSLALNCASPFSFEGADSGHNWRNGLPVRVLRNYKLSKFSIFAPKEGNRYDGIYKIVKYWKERGISGFFVWRFLFRRDDPIPAPWTQEGMVRMKNYEMVKGLVIKT